MSSFIERMLGAAKLDAAVYEEVEADKSALPQALVVVVLASVAAGVGAMVTGGVTALIIGTIASLIGWFIWAFLTWIIGTKLLPEKQTEADMGQLLRTIGFSSSPGILRVFGVIPGIGGIIVFLCSIWMLAGMIVGVRQALDYTSTWRAIGVCIIGWIVLLILQALALVLIGGAAA